jgi:hypothetical protein
MPNPFKRSGSAYLPPEWTAPNIGLLGALAAEPVDTKGLSFAFLGEVGSGKTTALYEYRQRLQRSRPKDIALWIDVGTLKLKETLRLHRKIYQDLVYELGEAIHEKVAQQLPQVVERKDGRLSDGQIYLHLESLARHADHIGRRVHVIMDECQRPGERFAEKKDVDNITAFWEVLKNLSEYITRGNGCMAITMTESGWDPPGGPAHARDRFATLRAKSLEASEIQAFVELGLKHTGGDQPNSAEPDIGQYMEGLEVFTMRQVHNVLHDAWRRANLSGAKTLANGHIDL